MTVAIEEVATVTVTGNVLERRGFQLGTSRDNRVRRSGNRKGWRWC